MTVTHLRGERQDPPRRLISIAEVAERLGVSLRYIRRLVQERRIPFIKVGHLIRFDLEEVEVWLNRSRVPAKDTPSVDDGPTAA